MRCHGGDDQAISELLTKAPQYFGLEERIRVTPLLPSELLQLVNRFFVSPPRRPMASLELEPPATGGVPAASPSTS
jgi:hypothetical protein